MIFLVIGLLMILFFVLYYLLDKYTSHDNLSLVCIGIALLLLIVFIILALVHGLTFIDAKSTKVELQAQYDMIMYQLENHIYEEDLTSISMFQFFEKIEKWNTKLATCKELQRDFWLGIFYPDIYDDFKFIIL